MLSDCKEQGLVECIVGFVAGVDRPKTHEQAQYTPSKALRKLTTASFLRKLQHHREASTLALHEVETLLH